ncbi:PH domain-containing protein [Micromonospora peucetia]|uniref:PH domain-containing protein n=1 Tax=Micromonospora peucetia TaxID=47871 RepID=A0A1C6UZ24_9ACTN|nr:PH domain-containing protein [Micromonospora peucetia]WSA35077.1 PH domain-containing protein [Micromonospora peucetia]SCL59259.1 PH domain-containing protein [Micromonospora peucetia]
MRPHPAPARQWRVPPALPALKLTGSVALLALALLLDGGDLVRLALAVLMAAALAGWATRDLVAPVRMAVDPDGITVIQGFAGHRRLPWSAVEKVTVDRHTRRGLTGEMLEIDAGESLHLFGRHDLGADPAEVAEALHEARPH